jgi:hypothetical protein
MLSQAHRAQAGPRLPPLPLPAPRVCVHTAEQGQVIEPVAASEQVDFREAFFRAFGTTDEVVAQALYEQILNALHAASGRPVDNDAANLALALIREIAPGDAVEAMLASQMIVAHIAAMDASRRALHAEQTPAGRQAYLSLTRKLMTLFTLQMDALNRHRGKATVQKVVVEKVLIASGAQAVVGAISGRREGDGR